MYVCVYIYLCVHILFREGGERTQKQLHFGQPSAQGIASHKLPEERLQEAGCHQQKTGKPEHVVLLQAAWSGYGSVSLRKKHGFGYLSLFVYIYMYIYIILYIYIYIDIHTSIPMCTDILCFPQQEHTTKEGLGSRYKEYGVHPGRLLCPDTGSPSQWMTVSGATMT